MASENILDEAELAALKEAAAIDNMKELSRDAGIYCAEGAVTELEIPHAGKARTPAEERLVLVNERFQRIFGASLLRHFKNPIPVEAEPARVCTFSDLRKSLEVPVSINVMRLPPLRGVVLCIFDWRFLFGMVDRYFGGNGELPEAPSNVQMSVTDQRIVDSLFDLICADLKTAWSTELELEVERLGYETDPRFADIPGLGDLEKLLSTSFELSFSEGACGFQFVLPESVLDQIDLLHESPIEDDGRDNTSSRQAWRENIQNVELDFESCLLNTTVSLQRLLSLKPGDVLPVEMPETVELATEGVTLLQGTCGEADGLRAVRVSDWAIA